MTMKTGMKANAAAAQTAGAAPAIERIACGTVNCFVVSQGDSAVLVDTGTAKYRDKILKKCGAANVRLIVITHGHYDHAQNAAYLARRLDVPIAMHSADIPLLGALDPDAIQAHSAMGRLMVRFMKLAARPVAGKVISWFQNSEIPAFAPDIALRDGDSLEEYGVSAAVIALPGHTMGSVGLRVGGSDLLVGDALFNVFKPQKAVHYLDRAAMGQSARSISDCGGLAIHFGHGESMTNRSW